MSSSSPCTTTVDVYDYYVNVHTTTPGTDVAPSTPTMTRTSTENHVPLPSRTDSTTTSTAIAVNIYFHYDRPENVYFLYTAPNLIRSEKARFEGITVETMTRGRMPVLYEMRPMFAPCPNCSLHVPPRLPSGRSVGAR
ncbi:hypothetical protein VPH35_066059 [Triticum aestivum]